jgi:hypothetical protein
LTLDKRKLVKSQDVTPSNLPPLPGLADH